MTATRLIFFAAIFALAGTGLAAPGNKPLSAQTAPDTLEMNNGTTIRGLILKNSAHSVLIQTQDNEREVPKSEIRRIRDEMDGEIVFPEVMKPGRLPSWRAMIYDLRHHDSIRSLEQIPATTISEGYLKNVPYLSFRVNEQSEFNVYGNPNDPVAIEFGMYGKQRGSSKHHRIVREFLAGHLHSKEQIATLYALSFKGGEKQVGPLALKITPPKEADAYGGWWICVYNPSRLDSARVSDAKYAAVTKPFEDVSHRDGRLRKDNLQKDEDWLAGLVHQMTGSVPQVRGFYRDKDGVFRLISFGNGS